VSFQAGRDDNLFAGTHRHRTGVNVAAVNSSGVDIHYDVYADGERPWLVFAHGAGGNAACWWQQVRNGLSTSFGKH
jgi:hypothetical protein